MALEADKETVTNIGDLFSGEDGSLLFAEETDAFGNTETLPVLPRDTYNIASGIIDKIENTATIYASEVDFLVKHIYHLHLNMTNPNMMALRYFKGIAYFFMVMPLFWYEENDKKIKKALGSMLLGIAATKIGTIEAALKEHVIESIVGLHYLLLNAKTQYAKIGLDNYHIQNAITSIFATDTLNVMHRKRTAILETSVTRYSDLLKMIDVYVQWAIDKDDKKALDYYDFVFKGVLHVALPIVLNPINK